jgi:EmrB/QacA subfamily drug resistance transporter
VSYVPPEPPDATERKFDASTRRRRRLTLAATALGSSLAFIDSSVVIVALPTIEGDLGLGFTGQQWVVLSYSVALAALYLVAGAAGDRLGRHRMFVWGVIGFAAASALAGAAPSEEVLVAARVLQGIGGAFLTTNSLGLLRAVYGRDSGRAIGLWTTLTGAAIVLGPPVGGALVEWASWRWIFYINLPLAAVALGLLYGTRRPESDEREHDPFDFVGATLAACGFGFLTFGLVQGQDSGFAQVSWALALGVGSLIAFPLIARRVRFPMLPLSLFLRRAFVAANVETLLVYGGLGGFAFFFVLFLQFLGFSPFAAGLINLPISVIIIVLSPTLGRVADRRGPRELLTAGPILMATGMAFFFAVTDRSDFWIFGPPGVVVVSVGLALVVAPITSTALAAAPSSLSGIAAGVNQTASRVGNLVTVALAALVVGLVFEHVTGDAVAIPFQVGETSETLRHGSITAFRAAVGVCIGVCLASAVVAAALLPRRPLQSGAPAE